MTRHGIVLWESASAALRGEKALAKAGIKVKLIPVPRKFSSECGLALRFDWELRDQVQRALEEAKLDYGGIHAL